VLEGAAEVFESGRGRKDQEQTFQVREERLERKIGQLVVEVDWRRLRFTSSGERVFCARTQSLMPKLALRSSGNKDGDIS
jgi:hypothetical protein